MDAEVPLKWSCGKAVQLLLYSSELVSLFMHLRQWIYLSSSSQVPTAVEKVISLEEYTHSLRHWKIILLQKACKAVVLLTCSYTNYFNRIPRMLWDVTAKWSSNTEKRTIIYCALEHFISQIMVQLPVLAYVTLTGEMNASLATLGAVGMIVASTLNAMVDVSSSITATNTSGPEYFIHSAIFRQVFSIVGQIVFIELLAPFSLLPLPEGSSKENIYRILFETGYSPSHSVYVEPTVKSQSNVGPNAYHAGLLGSSLIVVTGGLLRVVDPDDIAGVIAHELGHWEYRHSLIGLMWEMTGNVVQVFLSMWALGNPQIYQLYQFDPNDLPHPIAAVHICNKYILPAAINILSGLRHTTVYFCEYAADRFAVNLGYQKQLRNSLLSIYSETKSPPVHPWYAAWYEGHPSIVKRIEVLWQRNE